VLPPSLKEATAETKSQERINRGKKEAGKNKRRQKRCQLREEEKERYHLRNFFDAPYLHCIHVLAVVFFLFGCHLAEAIHSWEIRCQKCRNLATMVSI
jgi:hypothetical protein